MSNNSKNYPKTLKSRFKGKTAIIRTDGFGNYEFEPEQHAIIRWSSGIVSITGRIQQGRNELFSGQEIQSPNFQNLIDTVSFLAKLPIDAKDMRTLIILTTMGISKLNRQQLPEIRVHSSYGQELRQAFLKIQSHKSSNPNMEIRNSLKHMASDAVKQAYIEMALNLRDQNFGMDDTINNDYISFIRVEDAPDSNQQPN